MPVASNDGPVLVAAASTTPSTDHPPRISQEKVLKGVLTVTNGAGADHRVLDHRSDPCEAGPGVKNNIVSNGVPAGATERGTDNGRQRPQSKAGSTHSIGSNPGRTSESTRLSSQDDHSQQLHISEVLCNGQLNRPSHQSSTPQENKAPRSPVDDFASIDSRWAEDVESRPSTRDPQSDALNIANVPPNRFSSPPIITTPTNQNLSSGPIPRLSHRHTLQMPKVSSTISRPSREFSFNARRSEDTISPPERISPTAADPPRNRRSSLGLVRRTTKPLQTDGHVDEYPADEDAIRWTEAIRQKRASKRRRRTEEDEERVVVGTKVDQSHVNWVTAYNMLTGIRFTVSRTNAKMDRELTDADFNARHKFSFDVTGNELTPSAKYDFKFKDYSPWAFRHLRAIFGIDPADYLVSLTSKYILSELGSPGKSGSFFYFSRDYKYIIKTIHPAEHRLLRKILRDYYRHVLDNPNTLLSQFYGLHRVKIPYGRKIHFVVMNNLFPPHRDIHQMFDLKGSTIGRDFREEDLEKNPRATLKDLNWLRRNKRLELGPGKREMFLEQMRRDVSLLQRLHIMDYSMLVGIHDLGKGNEQNLRENMLKVFQPGGEKTEDEMSSVNSMLTRTATRQENARKAKELRMKLKSEKPVPMGMVQAKMPDEMAKRWENRMFYSEDGGFQATHDNGEPGEVIYYLGIIDCLTHYGFIKHLENFWKGLSYPETQISPIPPDRYGERFMNFITGITMAGGESEWKKTSESTNLVLSSVEGAALTNSLDAGRSSAHSGRSVRSPVEKTMERAQKQLEKSGQTSVDEQAVPDRRLGAMRTASAERTHGEAGSTLPVVEEAGEGGSTGGRSGTSVGGGTATVEDTRQNSAPAKDEEATFTTQQQPLPQSGVPRDDANMISQSLTASPKLMGEKSSGLGELEKPTELDLSRSPRAH